MKVLTSEAAELEMIRPPWKQRGAKHVYRVEGGVCMSHVTLPPKTQEIAGRIYSGNAVLPLCPQPRTPSPLPVRDE